MVMSQRRYKANQRGIEQFLFDFLVGPGSAQHNDAACCSATENGKHLRKISGAFKNHCRRKYYAAQIIATPMMAALYFSISKTYP
jgi:hypothetical protein